MSDVPEPSGRTVLVAGATSAGGEAAARALVVAGANVVVVGRDEAKVHELTQRVSGTRGYCCDLSDEAAVADLARAVHGQVGRLDGVLHLVGGWRGGGGIAGQSEEDYRSLETSFTALRYVSRAFFADLTASSCARLAIVSTSTLQRPLAGGANYSAVKAASEAWTRSLAHGFAKDARDASRPLCAAAFVYRIKSLAGHEQALAEAFIRSWAQDAGVLNDTIITMDWEK